eukprot:14671760-Heterocapsa_arctica.AAC.1
MQRHSGGGNENTRGEGKAHGDKNPTRSPAGNQGDRDLWSGTADNSFDGWSLKQLPLMLGFWTKQVGF